VPELAKVILEGKYERGVVAGNTFEQGRNENPKHQRGWPHNQRGKIAQNKRYVQKTMDRAWEGTSWGEFDNASLQFFNNRGKNYNLQGR